MMMIAHVISVLTVVHCWWFGYSEDMEVTSDSEEAANYHQILEFFEMCANLITTLARWSNLLCSTCWYCAIVNDAMRQHFTAHCFQLGGWYTGYASQVIKWSYCGVPVLWTVHQSQLWQWPTDHRHSVPAVSLHNSQQSDLCKLYAYPLTVR